MVTRRSGDFQLFRNWQTDLKFYKEIWICKMRILQNFIFRRFNLFHAIILDIQNMDSGHKDYNSGFTKSQFFISENRFIDSHNQHTLKIHSPSWTFVCQQLNSRNSNSANWARSSKDPRFSASEQRLLENYCRLVRNELLFGRSKENWHDRMTSD